MSLRSFDIAKLEFGQVLNIKTETGREYWLVRVESGKQPDARFVYGLSVTAASVRDIVLQICSGTPVNCYAQRFVKIGEQLLIGRKSASEYINTSTHKIIEITLLS